MQGVQLGGVAWTVPNRLRHSRRSANRIDVRDDMTNAEPLPMSASKGSRRPSAALSTWVSIASLVVSALLLAISPNGGFALAVLLGAAAGLLGLVLAIRARKTNRPASWALACSLVGLVVSFTLLVVIAVGVARPQLTQVELRAQGGPSFAVTFADDVESYTETWATSGWKRFTTTTSTAEITVTAPADDTSSPISCQILWNGEIVVSESSDRGTVTCRYDEA